VLVTAKARGSRTPLSELTPRELEVLAAIAEGKSNAAISEGLVLTKRAVEKHINAIFLKLNLSHSQSADDVSPRVKAALLFLADSDVQLPMAASGRGPRAADGGPHPSR
jgi:DNA-binding NarL/FixJ family response regulator